jgi:butyrate kinase
MIVVKFLKDFAGKNKGDLSSNLDGILASKLVNVLKVAEYVTEN